MRKIMDNFEDAAAALKNMGEKAVDHTKHTLDKVGDGIERAMDEAKEALERVIDGLAAANGVSALKNGANGIKTDVTGNEICLETAGNIIKNCGAVNGFESELKYTEMHRILKQIGWIITNAKSETASVTVRDADESGIMLD